ncbi:MAG: DNA repair exonuclease [Clostridiales bacterium]|nr:DNA repair exonuclease [Clostridiales bacterium]
MNKLRFIHTADIHLGSFLHVGGDSLPPALGKAIETATLEGFSRVCDSAISHNVDFVAISGDLYDSEARSVKAISYFIDQCKRLEKANIHVFVIAGNHDPLRQRQELFKLPQNVKLLAGSQPEICELLDDNERPIARVIGQSYTNTREQKKLHLDYRVADNSIWNIALLHTQLEAPKSNYIPCSVAELKDIEDIHYWALGHIHQPRILNNSFPYIAYPGIPQGRDFGEQGRGGCMLVELDPLEGGKITFIPTAPVIYKRIDVYIDEDPDSLPQSLDDLEDMLTEHGHRLMEQEGEQVIYPIEGYVIEWILWGRGDIHNQLKEQEQEVLQELTDRLRRKFESSSPFLWTDCITLKTQPSIDYDSLMKDSLKVQELDKIINRCLDGQTMKRKLIRELGEIWSGDEDHETGKEYVFHMDQSTLEETLWNAKQLIIEKLVEGRE